MPLAQGAFDDPHPRMIAALAAGLLPSAAFAAACPGQSFEAFLTAFGQSAQVQRAHVADPLLSGSIDADAEPEPRMVKRKVSAASLAFPVMPLEARRRHDGLAMSKTARAAVRWRFCSPSLIPVISFAICFARPVHAGR
jgi:hypothetical protein